MLRCFLLYLRSADTSSTRREDRPYPVSSCPTQQVVHVYLFLNMMEAVPLQALPVVAPNALDTPLSETGSNVPAVMSRRLQRSKQRLQEFQQTKRAARWPNMVQRLLARSRAKLRNDVREAWQRLTRARAKIRRALWLRWTMRSISLEMWNSLLAASGIKIGRFGRRHPVGFDVLAPLSPRDIYIYRRATALMHVATPLSQSYRSVLDWLRVPTRRGGGPHWLHQRRIEIGVEEKSVGADFGY